MTHVKFWRTSLAATLLAIGFALPALGQTPPASGASGASGTAPSTSTSKGAAGTAGSGGQAAGSSSSSSGSGAPGGSAGSSAPGSSTSSSAGSGAPGATSGMAPGATSSGSSSTPSRSSTSSTTGSKPDTTASGSSAALSRSDRKFIEDAAKGGMAEVQLGKLAVEKAGSPQVKEFGKRMVDDHTKANAQLQQLASTKNVSLPQEIDRSHQRDYDRLQKLSGAQFDREYMKHMVSDHVKDVKEFQKTAKSAKDPDVKTFAQGTLPTLEEHLRQAKADEASVKGSGNNKQRQASS